MSESRGRTYLEKQIGDRIKRFDSTRIWYRRANLVITLATATLSAIATVCIGMNQAWPSAWLSVPALVCSAAISVASAVDGYLRSKDMWVLKDDARVALLNLQCRMNFTVTMNGGTLGDVELRKLYDEYNQILRHEHQVWRTLRTIRDQAGTGHAASQGGR